MNVDGPAKTKLNHCPESARLRRFLLGKLADDEIEAVGAHLAICPECEVALVALEATRDSFIEYLCDYDESLCEEQGYRELQRRLAEPTDSVSGARHRSTLHGAPCQPSVSDSLPVELGNYQLIEKLGQGAMGAIYRAWHTRLKRTVAVKLLSPRWLDDPYVVERFAGEMEALGKLDDHPNVIRARDAGESDGQHYLVMDYVAGIDLGRLLLRIGPLRVADACEIARQAALGLAHAHRHGLLHRDVKPSNLMLTRAGCVQVLDLGLAIFRGDATAGDSVVGTADYMAPEQWVDGAHLDVGVDVYGLGCTLYKLLVGHAPFATSAAGPRAKRRAHTRSAPPALSDARPDVPAELDDLVSRMLAKRPSRRLASARQIADALAPLAATADVEALAHRVLETSDDTQRNIGDATLAQRVWGPLTMAKTSRRRWLVGATAACALVAGGPRSVWRYFTRTPYELLAAVSSEHIHHQYDRKSGELKSHATNQVLYRLREEEHASYHLSTGIELLDRDVEAGLFFAYYEKSERDYYSRQFEVIGVRASEIKGAIGMFRRNCSVAHHGESAYWTWRDIVDIDVPVAKDELVSVDELKIVVQDGRLTSVFLEGREIGPLTGPDFDYGSPPDRSFSPPPLAANPCGIFHTEGTCCFRGVRLEPDISQELTALSWHRQAIS